LSFDHQNHSKWHKWCQIRYSQYAVEYGDGSNSTGTYSSDKLTLTPAHAVRGFRFGCSHADPLITDRTAGLLGLGGGVVSLVGQTAEKAFSYCLPPTEAHSGFLTLGAPPRASAASRFVVTPMHRVVNASTFYGVLLQGIAVAGRRLNVPRSVFAAGSVVDSGTVITQLPPTAYRALRAAFREEMRMRMYPRVAPTNDFDTCFNLSGAGAGDDGVKLPSVALVFDRGATMELHPSGILYDVQQRTFEVLYE